MSTTPERCGVCGWLKVEHLFNIHCPAATAASDQLEAEVAETMKQPVDPSDQALVEQGMEVVREVLAYARFKRDLNKR